MKFEVFFFFFFSNNTWRGRTQKKNVGSQNSGLGVAILQSCLTQPLVSPALSYYKLTPSWPPFCPTLVCALAYRWVPQSTESWALGPSIMHPSTGLLLGVCSF